MKLFSSFAAIALMLVVSSAAEASLLKSLMTFDGKRDTFEDASAGNIIERGTIDGRLELGDIVQGLVEIGEVNGTVPNVAGGSIFAAYSFVVDEIIYENPGDPTSNAVFVRLRAATGTDNIMSILSDAGVADGRSDTNYLNRGYTDAIAVIETTDVVGLNQSDGSAGLAAAIAGLSGDFKTRLTAGFDGVDDDHIIARVAQPIGGGFVLDDLADLTQGFGQNVRYAAFAGTYSVTGHSFGEASFATFQNDAFPAGTSFGELIIANGSLEGRDSSISGTGWAYQDDGNYQLNAIPEPASIAIWSVLGAGALGLCIRRRYAKKA